MVFAYLVTSYSEKQDRRRHLVFAGKVSNIIMYNGSIDEHIRSVVREEYKRLHSESTKLISEVSNGNDVIEHALNDIIRRLRTLELHDMLRKKEEEE